MLFPPPNLNFYNISYELSVNCEESARVRPCWNLPLMILPGSDSFWKMPLAPMCYYTPAIRPESHWHYWKIDEILMGIFVKCVITFCIVLRSTTMTEFDLASFIFSRLLCIPVCFHVQNNITCELAESIVRKDENKKGFVDTIWLLEQKVNHDKISFTLYSVI